jgi:hypothetical protein
MTCLAGPVGRKGRGHEGRMVEKRRWKGTECNSGIKERGVRRRYIKGKTGHTVESSGRP